MFSPPRMMIFSRRSKIKHIHRCSCCRHRLNGKTLAVHDLLGRIGLVVVAVHACGGLDAKLSTLVSADPFSVFGSLMQTSTKKGIALPVLSGNFTVSSPLAATTAQHVLPIFALRLWPSCAGDASGSAKQPPFIGFQAPHRTARDHDRLTLQTTRVPLCQLVDHSENYAMTYWK